MRKPLRKISRRKHTRVASQPWTYAEVSLPQSKGHLMGIVYNEAFGGCGVIFPPVAELKVGAEVELKVGKSNSLTARVAWRHELDPDVIKIGFEYLD